MDRSRWVQAKFWLTYFITISLFGFLVLEGAVRLLRIAPHLPTSINVADEHLPYKPLPLSVATSKQANLSMKPGTTALDSEMSNTQ